MLNRKRKHTVLKEPIINILKLSHIDQSTNVLLRNTVNIVCLTSTLSTYISIGFSIKSKYNNNLTSTCNDAFPRVDVTMTLQRTYMCIIMLMITFLLRVSSLYRRQVLIATKARFVH